MNAAHLHLLLNHLPVVGSLFAVGVIAIGLLFRREAATRVGLGLALVVALLAVPAYLTGEPAEDVAEKLPGVSKAVIEPHEEAAGLALGAVLIFGAAAAVVLLVGRGGRPIRKAWLLLVLLCGLVSAGTLAYTALLGGQVRHTEIRSR
ncbi:MAG: hypothetical protein HZA90_28080 [Verrucomicrobia bacterium]|nr:hypothetical protein [Verrucomicrobiota bacterium]